MSLLSMMLWKNCDSLNNRKSRHNPIQFMTDRNAMHCSCHTEGTYRTN